MKIIKDYVTPSFQRRPQIPLDWETITVHNTANEKSNAYGERAWLDNPDNEWDGSWHEVIHEDTIIQAVPEDEVAWHAGDGQDGKGNLTSYSIEFTESGDQQTTLRTGCRRIAQLLHAKGKGIEAVVPHQIWTGKNCPRKILPYWDAFIKTIEFELSKLQEADNPWSYYTGVEYLHREGIVSDLARWKATIKNNEILPAWVTFEILAKIYKKLKGV